MDTGRGVTHPSPNLLMTTTTRPHKTPAPNLRERFDVIAMGGFRCAYCGASAKTDRVRLQVDHVVAKARDGVHDRVNLVPACGPCNLGKADRPIPYPRWARITDRWDRCECSTPAGLAADPDEPLLLCTTCRFPAYLRVFGTP